MVASTKENVADRQAAESFLSRYVSPQNATQVVAEFQAQEWKRTIYGPSENSGESVLFQKIPGEEGVTVEFSDSPTGLRARVEMTGPNLAATRALQKSSTVDVREHLGVQRISAGKGTIRILSNPIGAQPMRQVVDVLTGSRPAFITKMLPR